ncbi:DUF4249 domain-containing protein [Fibrella aquatilis]|nr:DUF4249 domain-containing protein [Fibrella aquatilis]
MPRFYKTLPDLLARRLSLRRFLVPPLLYVGVMACVTPYQPETKSLPNKILIVDGYITNQLGPHQVSLTYTADYTNASVNFRADKATVYLTDSTGKRQDFLEVSPGLYRTPASFSGVTGQKYKLNITLADGRKYESTPETITAAPPVLKVYDEYTEKPVIGTKTFDKGFNIYLDTKDPATPGDYYRWRWTNFDPVIFCNTRSVTIRNNTTEYGYYCCQQCWDVRTCAGPACLNATSDEAINGNAISRQFILRAPFESFDRYYVEIEQLAISRAAYVYYKTIGNLTSNNGGIFDAAPASVRGNMKSLTNPDEPVFGFFSAAGAQKLPYVVDRTRGQGAPNIRVQPLPDPATPPPPCAACVESDFRTRIKPRWWTF